MLNLSKGIFVVALLCLMYFYFYTSTYVKNLDHKMYDFTTIFLDKFKEHDGSTYSVVVDIDEKSIKDFGQWPWSRVIDAELINKISNMSPSAIGVNILFPEEDRLSPLAIQAFYQKYFNLNIDLKTLPLSLQDNDKILHQALEHANVTLPIYLQNDFPSAKHCATMSYRNNIFTKVKTSFELEELLCNHAVIQNKIQNFGFINAWSDDDGIFRRLPLFMQYQQEVFPSFALATLLSFDESLEVNQEEEMVLLNFSLNQPKVISASDVLNNQVHQSDFQGKIVIVGSSVVGLNLKHRTLHGRNISNSMIHAMLIDNLLSDTFLVQPEIYKHINMLLSLFFIFVVFQLFSRRNYLNIMILIIGVVIISTVFLMLMYLNQIYISIGYFWIPFISLFVFLLLYHLRVVDRERREQEVFLVRQSKLASMGEMISLIAHQWRQPLSSINGTVLNLDIDYRKQQLNALKFDTYLNDIESTTAYLSQTINDFSDFFSNNKKMQRFNIRHVLQQVEYLLSISLPKDITVIYELDEEIDLYGHSSELVQSLLVLINNAIFACVQNLEQIREGRIKVRVFREDKIAILLVEDNGGGIKKENIKTIFNPYFTTKEKHNGTGLGLYILKLIVEESMNGKVAVENGKEGAIFSIKIPMGNNV